MCYSGQDDYTDGAAVLTADVTGRNGLATDGSAAPPASYQFEIQQDPAGAFRVQALVPYDMACQMAQLYTSLRE